MIKRVVAVLVSVISLAACSGSAQSPSADSIASPDAPLVGAYAPGVPASWSGLTEFRGSTGISPRIALYYSTWHEKFWSAFASTAWRHNAYTFVKMQPYGVTLTSIAAGTGNGYLRSYALAVRAFRHPVIISFAHEMNGDWYPWGTGHETPSVFIAAWRHVVQVFRDAGATNVIWVWTVNATNIAPGSLRRWWPGAAWVDWVGVDGYYYRAADSFESVFGRAITQIREFSSAPVLIAETAVGTTSDRKTQIARLFAGSRAAGVVAVIWFDLRQDHGILHQDWRLEDDPAAVAAFGAAAQTYEQGPGSLAAEVAMRA